MNDHKARETRILQPHPNAEQRGFIDQVALPIVEHGIDGTALVVAAKIAVGKGDGKK